MKSLMMILTLLLLVPALARSGVDSSGGTNLAYVDSMNQIVEVMRDPAVIAASKRQWVKSISETANKPNAVTFQIVTTGCIVVVQRVPIETSDGQGRIVNEILSSTCSQ